MTHYTCSQTMNFNLKENVTAATLSAIQDVKEAIAALRQAEAEVLARLRQVDTAVKQLQTFGAINANDILAMMTEE